MTVKDLNIYATGIFVIERDPPSGGSQKIAPRGTP